MKVITRFLPAMLVLALPLTGMAQQGNGIENEKGFEVSQKNGVMSKLKLFEKKSINNPFEFDADNRLWSRLGVATSASAIKPKSGMDVEYDFYGGVSERGNNVPMASVTDAEGNTYITGGSSNLEQQSGDVYTIKVSPAGTVLWQVREQAAVFAVDTGLEIALDNDNNVIVSGTYWNGTDTDMQVVKYNPADGSMIWKKIYEGAGEGVDVPTSMIADDEGNIVIAGITWSGNSIDYLTVKYSTEGNLLWDVTDNPAGADAWNEPAAIALDADNNIIVTGYSPNGEGWLTYYTAKYNSADGVEVWAQSRLFENHQVEDDPESPLVPTNSTPSDIVTDADGNIYITGTFDTFSDRFGTIKYNAAGVEQWVQAYKSGTEYTSAHAIALNGDALYVAGGHYGESNDDGLVLASYDLDGTLNWVEESNDFIQVNDVKLVVDAEGNPVLAGFGMHEGEQSPVHHDTGVRAKKYDAEGNLIAESQYIIEFTGSAGIQSLNGIALGADNTINFTMASFYSTVGAAFETLKTTFQGAASTPQWDMIHTNTGGFNATVFNAVADNDGNTYTTGAYYKYNAELVQLDPTYFVVKYSPDGTIAWEKNYNAENGNVGYGIIVNIDPDDNVFIALLPHQQQENGELKLKKYSPDGTLLWEAEKMLINARIMTMQLTADGDLYIAGTAKENVADFSGKFTILKYSAGGDEEWTLHTGNGEAEANYFDLGAGVTDAQGNFIFTGTSGLDSMMFDDIDLTVAKINADGTVAWNTVAQIDNYYGKGNGLVLHNDGSIAVSGVAVRDSGNLDDDFLAAKFSAAGEVLWTKTVGVSDRHERVLAVKKLSTGETVVAGYSQAMSGASIYNLVIKYDEEGNDIWTYESESRRFFNDFHVDGNDKCYILNQAQVSTLPYRLQNGPFPAASLIVLETDGTDEEEFLIGPAYSETYASVLVPHKDDRLLLAGSLANQSFYEGIYFFETEHEGSLDLDDHEVSKDKNHLGQNYPNPVSGSTEIPFYLVNGGKASIKLYNNQARLVKEIANDYFSPGQNIIRFDRTGLAEGIYFYQITSGSFKQARKMVVAGK